MCFVHAGRNPSLSLTRQIRFMEEGQIDQILGLRAAMEGPERLPHGNSVAC